MIPCHSYHKLFIGFVKTNFSALTVRACSRVKEAARSSRSTKNSASAQAWQRASGDASHVSQCQVTPEKMTSESRKTEATMRSECVSVISEK